VIRFPLVLYVPLSVMFWPGPSAANATPLTLKVSVTLVPSSAVLPSESRTKFHVPTRLFCCAAAGRLTPSNTTPSSRTSRVTARRRSSQVSNLIGSSQRAGRDQERQATGLQLTRKPEHTPHTMEQMLMIVYVTKTAQPHFARLPGTRLSPDGLCAMIRAMELKQALKERALDIGFDLVGIAPVVPGRDLEFAREWLKRGYGGEMRYLANPSRDDPRAILPSVKSVICVGLLYETPLPYSTDAHPEGSKQKAVGRRQKAVASEQSVVSSSNASEAYRVSDFQFPVSNFQFPVSPAERRCLTTSNRSRCGGAPGFWC
jgi:hypothetical protein